MKNTLRNIWYYTRLILSVMVVFMILEPPKELEFSIFQIIFYAFIAVLLFPFKQTIFCKKEKIPCHCCAKTIDRKISIFKHLSPKIKKEQNYFLICKECNLILLKYKRYANNNLKIKDIKKHQL